MGGSEAVLEGEVLGRGSATLRMPQQGLQVHFKQEQVQGLLAPGTWVVADQAGRAVGAEVNNKQVWTKGVFWGKITFQGRDPSLPGWLKLSASQAPLPPSQQLISRGLHLQTMDCQRQQFR